MRKLFKLFAIFAVLVSFAACEETSEDGSILGFEGFNTSDLLQTIDCDAQNISFSFIADESWSATVIYDEESGWITITPEYGDPLVLTNMTIAVDENLDEDSRTAKVVIVSGDNQAEVKITQSGVGGGDEEDEDLDDGTSSQGKDPMLQYLITKIVTYELYEGEVEEDGIYEIEYDDQYRIVKAVLDWGMINLDPDIYGIDSYNYRKIQNFTYSDDKITELIEYDYGPADAQDDRTYVYNLNSDGFISSYSKSDRSGSYTYSDGYLSQYIYDNGNYTDKYNFVWQNGALATINTELTTEESMYGENGWSVVYNVVDGTNTFTYGNKDNLPSIIDVNAFTSISEVYSDDIPVFLTATGYLGAKISNYLVTSYKESEEYDLVKFDYSYTFDELNRPVQVKIDCVDEDEYYIMELTYGL